MLENMDKLRRLYSLHINKPNYQYRLMFFYMLIPNDDLEKLLLTEEMEDFKERTTHSFQLDTHHFMEEYSTDGLKRLVNLLNQIADADDLEKVYRNLFEIDGPTEKNEAILKIASYYSPNANRLYRRRLGIDKTTKEEDEEQIVNMLRKKKRFR